MKNYDIWNVRVNKLSTKASFLLEKTQNKIKKYLSCMNKYISNIQCRVFVPFTANYRHISIFNDYLQKDLVLRVQNKNFFSKIQFFLNKHFRKVRNINICFRYYIYCYLMRKRNYDNQNLKYSSNLFHPLLRSIYRSFLNVTSFDILSNY